MDTHDRTRTFYVAFDVPKSVAHDIESIGAYLHHHMIGCAQSQDEMDAIVASYRRYPFSPAASRRHKRHHKRYLVVVTHQLHRTQSGWEDPPLWTVPADASACHVLDLEGTATTFDDAIDRVDDALTLRRCTSALQLIHTVLQRYRVQGDANHFTAKRKGDSWSVRRHRKRHRRRRRRRGPARARDEPFVRRHDELDIRPIDRVRVVHGAHR